MHDTVHSRRDNLRAGQTFGLSATNYQLVRFPTTAFRNAVQSSDRQGRYSMAQVNNPLAQMNWLLSAAVSQLVIIKILSIKPQHLFIGAHCLLRYPQPVERGCSSSMEATLQTRAASLNQINEIDFTCPPHNWYGRKGSQADSSIPVNCRALIKTYTDGKLILTSYCNSNDAIRTR